MFTEKFFKQHYKIIITCVLTLFFGVSALNAYRDSATFDEVAHIPASYSYVTQHDTRLNPEHPPLIKDMAGFPLLFLDLKFDTTQAFWTGKLPRAWDEGQWEAGKHLLYEAGNDPDAIIFWARLPIVILSVIFGLFLFKWGKEIAGTTAGLFALILFVSDPNILGHNHYVTTDLGIAAFLTFSFYFFLKFIKQPSWKNVFWGGFFLGLLLVTKFSSIVALPVYGLTLFVYALAKNHRDKKNNWKTRLSSLTAYMAKGIIAFVIAFFVIWIVYKINDFAMPKETFDQTIDFFFSLEDTNAKASITNKALHFMNQSSITRPWANYLFGPAWMFKRVSGGNSAYFLGQVGNGFTNYFPIVFLIKETIPFLLLAFLASAYTLIQSVQTIIATKLQWKKMRSALGNFLRQSVSYYTLFIFIILYAYLSISGGLNIGFRHLFPILPFAYILITKKIFEFSKKAGYPKNHHISLPVLMLVLWIILIPVVNYPGYVSYFNESIGGSQNGYKYVTDSNTDWGQDLKRLALWIDEYNKKCTRTSSPCAVTHKGIAPTFDPIDKIRVDYFGGGNPQHVLGEKYIGWWDSMRPVQSGWYAISVNSLQGSIYDTKKSLDENYSWTREYAPIAMVGNSIMIFYVP